MSVPLYQKWHELFSAGLVYESNLYAKDYLSDLWVKKHISKALKFLEELKENNVDLNLIVEFEIIFLVMQKNYSKLDHLLREFNVDKNKEFESFVFSIFEKYDLSIDHIATLNELGLRHIFSKLEETARENGGGKGSVGKIEKKTKKSFFKKDLAKSAYEFISQAFKGLLRFDMDLDIIELLSEYAVFFERKRLLMALNVFCMRNVHLFEKNKKLLWRLQGKFSLIANFKDDVKEKEFKNEFDFGTDLFSSNSDDLSEKKRLERDILFLKKKGEHEKMKILLEKLERLDPGNTLIFSNLVIEKSHIEVSFQKNIDESMDDLLEDFKKYLPKKSSKGLLEADKVFDEKELVTSLLENVSNEELKDIYRDIVISFLEMDLHQAAKLLLEKVALFDSKDFLYLWCVSQLKLGHLGDSILFLENFLKKENLTNDDFVCFSYLLAECYRQNKDFRKAKTVYLAVEKVDKNYRLVHTRLNELEKF